MLWQRITRHAMNISDRRCFFGCALTLMLVGSAIGCGSDDGDAACKYRRSSFATFSSATGTASARSLDGSSENFSPAPNKPGGMLPGTCDVSLAGDIAGRVGDPDALDVDPSRVTLSCLSDAWGPWRFTFTTDNLAFARAGPLSINDPETTGPTPNCSDGDMPVEVTVTVTDVAGDVDRSAIDVGDGFLRRFHVVGRVGQTVCGLAEINLDILAEIRRDAFRFSDERCPGE